MTSSLVGSEMCIRDSTGPAQKRAACGAKVAPTRVSWCLWWPACHPTCPCLLYTSDAADDM
eukprot:9006312-Prorocentrum_lima.AAC.1